MKFSALAGGPLPSLQGYIGPHLRIIMYDVVFYLL